MKTKLLISTVAVMFVLPLSAQWNTITTPMTGKLQTVFFTGPTVGFTAGPFQYMYGTTDGGTTWTNVGPYAAMDIYFSDVNNGYAASVAGTGTMKRTTNGGNNWTNITPPNSSSLWGTFATNATTCYFVSTDDKVHKSTNGGTSFTSVNVSATFVLTDIWFTDANTGYVTSQDGKLFKTTNAGGAWTLNYTASGVQLNGVYFVNQNLGFACGSNGTILKTTNAGGSWSPLTTGTTTILSSVRFFDALNGIAVGYGGTIIRTIDGGTTWTTDASNTTKWLYSIAYTGVASTAVIVGDSGIVLKNTTIPVRVQELQPAPFTEMNCYPNPSTDVVTLAISSSVNATATTEVIAVDGQLVKSFPSTELTQGENQMTLNLADLTTGIYFIRVNAGEATIEKRIVILH